MRRYIFVFLIGASLFAQNLNIKVLNGFELFYTKPIAVKEFLRHGSTLGNSYVYNGLSSVFILDFAFELEFKNNLMLRFDVESSVLSFYSPGFASILGYRLSKRVYIFGGGVVYYGKRYFWESSSTGLYSLSYWRWNFGFIAGFGFKIWRLPYFEISIRRPVEGVGKIEQYNVKVEALMFRFSVAWEV